jgi:hypothetical protein
MPIERINTSRRPFFPAGQRGRGTVTMVRRPVTSSMSFGFPASLRTRPWTGRRSCRGAAPGLSRCSTPPDPPNHIHNRMSDLHGGGLGTTEPLRRSRCCLLLVFDRRSDVKLSIPRRQTAVCSQLLMLTKLMQKARGNACWTVSRRGTRGVRVLAQ